MRNGYFQLINNGENFALRMIPPQGGETLSPMEVADYLKSLDISFDLFALRDATSSSSEKILPIGTGICPTVHESYRIEISEDRLSCTARFHAASETGARVSREEFERDLKVHGIVYGIQHAVLDEHFIGEGIYCEDLVCARGILPKQGKDASIEYFFTENVQARPTLREDGSVDFFELNTVNHCRTGDLLARLTPEDPGEYGMGVDGNKIKPRDVKKLSLKYGPKIDLSEDKLTLHAAADGHVTIVDDKVTVSDILVVENVSNSTGNLDFEGSIQINGNIQSNFRVKANGNIMIGGLVEGAYVEATGDVVISRGMNGMGKGTLHAGGSIISKYLEGVTASAGTKIECGAIMHSTITAGEEIEVSGKRGLISGGHVSALRKISAKTLGAELGTNTIVEVGVNPETKARYHELQREIASRIKTIRDAQPLLENFVKRQASGATFTEAQKEYMINLAKDVKRKRLEMGSMNLELRDLQNALDTNAKAEILVSGTVHPGTKIVIGDVSMAVQKPYQYCRFEKVRGDVKANPL